MPIALANLVTPMTDANGNPSETPLEVILDTIGDVNRQAPGTPGPVAAADLGNTANELSEFFLDPTARARAVLRHRAERDREVDETRRLGRPSRRMLAVAVVLARSASASAAGLYFSDRGVRPLGRGGAFVAGADDLGAIWYNPAGIVDAPTSFLLDATWLHYTSNFTRQAQTTSDTGHDVRAVVPLGRAARRPCCPSPPSRARTASATASSTPRPSACTRPWSRSRRYPQTIDGGTPAPQRYSLVSIDGSLLVVTGAWFAWKPIEQLRVGAGFQMLVGTFKSTVDFSACPPDNLVCAGRGPRVRRVQPAERGPHRLAERQPRRDVRPDEEGAHRRERAAAVRRRRAREGRRAPAHGGGVRQRLPAGRRRAREVHAAGRRAPRRGGAPARRGARPARRARVRARVLVGAPVDRHHADRHPALQRSRASPARTP